MTKILTEIFFYSVVSQDFRIFDSFAIQSRLQCT